MINCLPSPDRNTHTHKESIKKLENTGFKTKQNKSLLKYKTVGSSKLFFFNRKTYLWVLYVDMVAVNQPHSLEASSLPRGLHSTGISVNFSPTYVSLQEKETQENSRVIKSLCTSSQVSKQWLTATVSKSTITRIFWWGGYPLLIYLNHEIKDDLHIS